LVKSKKKEFKKEQKKEVISYSLEIFHSFPLEIAGGHSKRQSFVKYWHKNIIKKQRKKKQQKK